MTTFDRLLIVQRHDTRIDQLRHRRETLPERAELVANASAMAELAGRIEAVEQARDTIAREQRRLEDEVAGLEAKRDEHQKVLYSGTVTNPRELQALQEEIDALGRRQAVLEDEILEQMEQLEPVAADLDDLVTRRSELEANGTRLGEALAAGEADVDAELAVEGSARDEAASGIEPSVVEEYERLRVALGGVAVAPLEGNVCGGCHLALSAVEADRIRRLPADERVTCEECGRLLVR